MGRYRHPNSTTRKRRNIEGRLAREARLDELSRKGSSTTFVIMDEVTTETTEDGDEWDYR